jgi:hypothetical protein
MPSWLQATLSVLGVVFGGVALALRLFENYRRPRIRLETPPPGSDGPLSLDVVNQSLMPLQVREVGFEFADKYREAFAVHRFDDPKITKPAAQLFADTYSMGTLLPPRSACYVTRPLAGIVSVAEMSPVAGTIRLRGYCILGTGVVLRTRAHKLSLVIKTLERTWRDAAARWLPFWR